MSVRQISLWFSPELGRRLVRARVSIESDPPQDSHDNEQQAEAADNRGDRPSGDGEAARDGLGAHDHGIPGQANQYRQAKRRCEPSDDFGCDQHVDHQDPGQGRGEAETDGRRQGEVEALGSAHSLGEPAASVELCADHVGGGGHEHWEGYDR